MTFLIVSVHVDGDGFEVVEHVSGPVWTVEGAEVGPLRRLLSREEWVSDYFQRP